MNLCDTINGIAVAESDSVGGGWSATFSNDKGTGSTAKRVIYCAWGDHGALLTYLLTANSISVGFTAMVIGASHPSYGGMFVNQVTPTPADEKFQYAKLEVEYKTLPFNPSDPALIREDSVTVTSEVVPLAKESVNFVAAPFDQLDRDSEQLITYLNYKVTLKQVSTIPIAAVIACLNCVNTGALNFQIGSAGTPYSVPAGQVLYNGIDEIKIGYTAAGSQRFDVTHSFLISPVNLNYEYNINSGAANVFDRFEDVTPHKYADADMSTLGV